MLAVGFTARQFFTENSSEAKRLFDSLRAPLTHCHEGGERKGEARKPGITVRRLALACLASR